MVDSSDSSPGFLTTAQPWLGEMDPSVDPTDPLRSLEKDDSEDLFKSAFNGSAGVIKITSDSDSQPGNSSHLQPPALSMLFVVNRVCYVCFKILIYF